MRRKPQNGSKDLERVFSYSALNSLFKQTNIKTSHATLRCYFSFLNPVYEVDSFFPVNTDLDLSPWQVNVAVWPSGDCLKEEMTQCPCNLFGQKWLAVMKLSHQSKPHLRIIKWTGSPLTLTNHIKEKSGSIFETRFFTAILQEQITHLVQ